MSEEKDTRKREKIRKWSDGASEPKTKETKESKQTKFVIDVGDANLDADQIQEIKNNLLKESISLLGNTLNADGEPVRPRITSESLSWTFSMSFSMG